MENMGEHPPVVDPMFFKKMGKVADRKHNVRVIDSSELDE
jgi:hypothetical protein